MLVNIYMLLAFFPQSVLFSLVHQAPNLHIYSSMFFRPSQHTTSFSVTCEMHATEMPMEGGKEPEKKCIKVCFWA